MSFEYFPRIIDAALVEKMSYTGAVLVRGPKWTGKTSTCEQLAKSALFLRDPDEYEQNMALAQTKPSLLLRGDTPRLIDEWQVAPVLWDAVISAVDKSKGVSGQYLLTGSATPVNPGLIKHTGTGRIARLTMRSMSLYESRESTGEVSLASLFEGGDIEGVSNMGVEDIACSICRGGWPEAVTKKSPEPYSQARDYLDAIAENDISEAGGIKRNASKAHALLRSLARCSAQEASLATLASDMSGDGVAMSEKTVAAYINSLRKIFVIEDIPAWAPTLRSKTPLRTSSTWHFTDPSLAAAALKTNAAGLLGDLSTMGFLFESLCVRDLRIYMDSIGGEVSHYRDKAGLEADAIVQKDDGTWGAIEVKLGGEERIEEGADHLKKLEEKIDTTKTPPPAFKAVLTGGKYAYRRDDGVFVVPLACLKP
ncbi:MAG: DUF4143 domain-containing protein [Raoultibacter sp.]